MSCLFKTFESVLNKKRMRYLSAYNLISDCQYGFRKGRSTGNLLAFLTESWSSSFRDFGETFAVGLDISKTYDRAWHKSFIFILPSNGFYSSFCTFISSFLSDRSIDAVVDGHCSSGFCTIVHSLSIIHQWSKSDSMLYPLLCWWHHFAFFKSIQQTPNSTIIKWYKARCYIRDA